MNDFMLDTMEITFSPGVLSLTSCLMVTAVDDDEVEGDHEFDINITSTSLDQQIDIIDPRVNTVTITDNDGMYVLLISMHYIHINFFIAGVVQIEFEQRLFDSTRRSKYYL